jgi:phage tail P2-like protein
MAENLLPASIDDVRSRALMGLLDRMAALPVSILTSLYDPAACPASALPFLAHQFGVLDEGWPLAATEGARRALVSQALQLQAKRGTPWAMRQALAAIGFPGLSIVERSSHWAKFKVTQPLGGQPVTADQVSRILAAIDRWKPARCVLEAIEFGVTFESNVSNAAPRFDGSYTFNGAIKYEGAVLASIAYVKIGAGSPSVRINSVTVQDLPDRTVVTFNVDSATANGQSLDTYAIYTAADTLIASATAPSVYKSASLTLAVTWTIHKI